MMPKVALRASASSSCPVPVVVLVGLAVIFLVGAVVGFLDLVTPREPVPPR